MDFSAEPFKIKIVESLKMTTYQERVALLEKAGNNLFSVPADSIFVDLLTDSGTSAMSDRQWAGMMIGDEAYAGSKSFFHFEKTVKDITNFKYVIPTHQGRVAENLLFSLIVNEQTVIPSNSHFDTTRANIEYNKGLALDLVVDEAYQPEVELPFKGNIDLKKLEAAIAKYGKARIPVCMITVTNNSGGGQPVSMQNIREVKALLDKHNIPLFIDAARFAENCYFIKKREKGYDKKTIMEIANEMFSYADGCTMSAKKDGLANIGGFLALNDYDMSKKLTNHLILIEGFPTYGGLAGRDLEALSIGLKEALEEPYLTYRINQIEYLSKLLLDAGISIVRPAGGHAVYLDAKKFYPHIPPHEFPGQVLAAELYKESGIRTVEIGSLMFGKSEGEAPKLELVRFAIPRRVYTSLHIKYVADAVIELYKKRDSARGMKITYEAPVLRHFTARLEFLK